MHISIIGAGAWGTALAASAALHNDVILYARSATQVAEMAQRHENSRYLPGIALPPGLRYSASLTECLAHAPQLIIIATPVAGLRSTCMEIAALAAASPESAAAAVVWLCKGFEESSGLLPHQVVAQTLPGVAAAVLSGPSFAAEVASHLPVALTIAGADHALVERVVNALHGGSMRVYRSQDMVGVEVGGAVKNVLAIATGIADGLELGNNARAALITRGLTEMMRLGTALGGHAETLMGLTGMGDLILTCTGALSRNRKVGLALGHGKTLQDTLAELGHVAEGVRCAATVRQIAAAHSVSMPICDTVCQVLFEGLSARAALHALLARSPKPEAA